MTLTARPHHERPSIRAADAVAALVIALLGVPDAVPRDVPRRPRADPPPAAGVTPRES